MLTRPRIDAPAKLPSSGPGLTCAPERKRHAYSTLAASTQSRNDSAASAIFSFSGGRSWPLGSQRISGRRVLSTKYAGRYNAAATSTTIASQRVVVDGVIGSEPPASVTMIRIESPSGSDSTCMPISAAARPSSTLSAERPTRRTPEPVAPERFNVLAVAFATNARRRRSSARVLMPSQRAIATSTSPVNATADNANRATAIAGSVGTSISVRCICGRSKSLPISRTTSQPTIARNTNGVATRRRASQRRAADGGAVSVAVVISGRCRLPCGAILRCGGGTHERLIVVPAQAGTQPFAHLSIRQTGRRLDPGLRRDDGDTIASRPSLPESVLCF